MLSLSASMSVCVRVCIESYQFYCHFRRIQLCIACCLLLVFLARIVGAFSLVPRAQRESDIAGESVPRSSDETNHSVGGAAIEAVQPKARMGWRWFKTAPNLPGPNAPRWAAHFHPAGRHSVSLSLCRLLGIFPNGGRGNGAHTDDNEIAAAPI